MLASEMTCCCPCPLWRVQESMARMEGLVSELSQSAENREYALVLEEKKKTKVPLPHTDTHDHASTRSMCTGADGVHVVSFSWSVFL